MQWASSKNNQRICTKGDPSNTKGKLNFKFWEFEKLLAHLHAKTERLKITGIVQQVLVYRVCFKLKYFGAMSGFY